jgi:hypothetical protein
VRSILRIYKHVATFHVGVHPLRKPSTWLLVPEVAQMKHLTPPSKSRRPGPLPIISQSRLVISSRRTRHVSRT